jgi:hypothetical protein
MKICSGKIAPYSDNVRSTRVRCVNGTVSQDFSVTNCELGHRHQYGRKHVRFSYHAHFTTMQHLSKIFS